MTVRLAKNANNFYKKSAEFAVSRRGKKNHRQTLVKSSRRMSS